MPPPPRLPMIGVTNVIITVNTHGLVIVVAMDALVVFTEDVTVEVIGLLDCSGGDNTDDTSEESCGHPRTDVVVVNGRVECECLCLDLHFCEVLGAELNDTDQVGGGSHGLDAVMWLEVRHLRCLTLK